MTIATNSVVVSGGAARVKIFGPATKNQTITITTNGSGTVIGGNNVTLENGFHMNEATLIIQLNATDEIWCVSTSDTEVSYIISL